MNISINDLKMRMIMKTLYTTYNNFAKRLVMSLIVLMTVGVGTMLGAEELAYTIVFSNGANGNSEIKTTTQASTVIASDSRKYVTASPFSAISKAYYGDTKTSIRLGTSSAAGALTIALSSDGQVSATKIVVSCGYWKSEENPTLSINSLASQSISSSEQDLTFNVNKDITSLSLNTSKRAYIYSISVYTEASAPTYAVTWDKNGRGDVSDVSKFPTTASSLTLQSLSATGYTNTGWTADVAVKDGSTTFNAGDLINNGTTVTLSQATTFTAQWSAKQVTITWSANGGIVTPSTSNYIYDGSSVTLPTPTRDGYNFKGWYTSASEGTQITDIGTNNKPASDVTYYAQWTAKDLTNYRTTCVQSCETVTIQKSSNSPESSWFSLAINSQSVPSPIDNCGQEDLTITIVPGDGYKITSVTNIPSEDITVSISSNGTSATVTYPKNTTIVSEVTLEAIEYTITLHTNGGTINAGNVTSYKYGVGATLPTDITRDGFAFGGWYQDENLYEGPVTNVGTSETDNKEFWAKWTELPKYTVSFSTGTGNPTQVSITETEGGAGVVLPTGPTPTCPDWTFAGWWTEEVSSTNTSPGTLMKAGDTYNPTSNITLYAVYSTQEAGDAFTGYAKVTTAPEDWSGKYLLSTGTYTANGTYDSTGEKGHLVRATYTPGKEEKAEWEFTLAKVGNTGYSILFPDGSYYLGYASSTNFARSTTVVQSDNVAYLWSPSTSGITNVGDNTRIIKDGGSDFRPYVNDNAIVYLYKRVGGGSTTIYNSNPTCLVPVWNEATIDKTALTVNCGERSPMTGANGAAIISFPTEDIYNFTKDIKIEATTGFLVSTSQNVDANYKSSVSLSPLVGTANANTFYDKHVYVRAEAPAMSEEDLSGTITIKNNKGETLQTFSVTADVTCNKCTVQFVDRGANYQEPILLYAGQTIDEAPAAPEGVCTDPIHYVFDGWAETEVSSDATSYSKVSFPYEVNGNTKFDAVYRYVEEGSGDSGDYVKLTEDLDDYSGDYLIVYEGENVAFDGGRNNVDDELDAASNTIEVTINGNTIASNATTDAAKFTIAKVDGGYSILSASGYYIGWGGSKNGLNASSSYTVNYLNTITDKSTICGKTGYLKYNSDNNQKRFRYYQSGQQAIALYKKAASYLYTTSPACGPHLEITAGKEIYVTGGNAQAARDLVMAQQKVSYKATRLKTKDGSAGGTAPDVKVATNGITKGGVVTTEVKVTFENTVKEQQPDDTYTITGDIVVTYEADANNLKEDIQVQLAVDYPANADARDNFTVHARSLPSEFVIVAKSGEKWYALNADMNGSKAQPANGQVTLNDLNNPTEAIYAPCNAIYTFEAMPQGAADRISVRFIGMENKYLWSASEGNTGIQNNSKNPTADALAYNWKLYTEDNITYHFGNAQNTRMLGLHSTNVAFGMYANGASVVQDIRILPYVEKCLYNYAPTNLKVSVLKGSSVTLTWDAVAGTTKYQYSNDGNTWTDAGTEPTVTINGLTEGMDYTYYIRAYHEDDATKECIDYSKISFTTADCDDVPTNITYTADLNSITVSWTAAAPTATITYNTKEDGTGGGGIINNATSPYKILGGLDKNTTYYIQILADGTCASHIIPVKTEDVEVDIVEWKTGSIIVDINTNETVSVSLENEVSYGSGTGQNAEELFFSKYFEGSGSLKMIAIYNGTGKDVDLSTYRIDRGSNGNATNISKTYDLSQLGTIKNGQEIIFYSWPLTSEYSYSCSKSFLDSKVQESGVDANPRWILCDAEIHNGIEFETMDFSGNDPLLLYKSSELIDVFGVSTEQESPASTQICSGRSDQAWSADGVTNMDYGKTTEDFPNGDIPHGVNVDDETITAYTARVIMFRKNTVVSGENAVIKNTTTFATFAEEWEARQVCMSGDDGDLTCAAYQELGTFDYSDYYTKYESMGDEIVFEENKRNPDGTVTIPITDLNKQSCRNIRIILKDKDGNVLTDREYKVPIMITTTQGTAYSEETKATSAFYALQENLATVEVDGSGNPTGKKTNLTLEQVREICKTCDVVVRDNATLMKMADDAANDHPQVRDIYVYENSSLIVPNGTNYTINNLSLRRKEDAVASVSAYPEALKLPESAAAPISLDFRLSAESWHWFTLPYKCNISEVTWVDGSPAQYNVDWFLMTYDGEKRAATQTGGNWKAYTGTTIKAGEGFILAINGNINNPKHTYELRFPMAKDVLVAEGTDKTVDVRAWGVETNIRPNHKGWNLVGNPYLAYYQRNNINNFEGLRLGELVGPDPQTGYWTQTGDVPYVVVPIGAGYEAYEQLLASETDLLPFTAYFVQVGNDGEHASSDELSISFDHTKLQLSATPMPASIVHRAPSEVNETEEPVIVGVALTNSLGESDKTSLVIADRFTNEYEMQADFFKWFGDYYKYYTKPVLYTIGADQGKRAFNALNEQLATQPIPMGMFAAKAGDYTFALNRRSDLSKVEEVWLHDANTNTYTNLMQNDYNFYTTKTDGGGRFTISVKLAPKVATGMENVNADKVWATTQNQQIIVNGLENNTQLWMYDAAGKLLYTEVTSNYQHRYSVPQVGTYFIALQKGTTKQTIKVVVE